VIDRYTIKAAPATNHKEIPKKFEEMKDFSPGWPTTRLGLYPKPATQYAAADDLTRVLMGGLT
jgi:hypothetical protein